MCHGTVMCAMAVLHPSGRPGWVPGDPVRAAQRPTMLLRAIRPRARAAGGVGCGRGVPQAGARNVSKHMYHAVRTRAAKRPPQPKPMAHKPGQGSVGLARPRKRPQHARVKTS